MKTRELVELIKGKIENESHTYLSWDGSVKVTISEASVLRIIRICHKKYLKK